MITRSQYEALLSCVEMHIPVDPTVDSELGRTVDLATSALGMLDGLVVEDDFWTSFGKHYEDVEQSILMQSSLGFSPQESVPHSEVYREMLSNHLSSASKMMIAYSALGDEEYILKKLLPRLISATNAASKTLMCIKAESAAPLSPLAEDAQNGVK